MRRIPILTPARKVWVRHSLRKGWSPEQIAGRYRHQGRFRISYQTVYRYLYQDRSGGGCLYLHLRRKGKRYRKKRLHTPISNRRFIEERPECVERRERIGDWELDTIVSSCRKAAIVTMVDRVSRLLMMDKVDRAGSYDVAKVIVRRLQSVKTKVHTLTADNGAEFATHRLVARKLEADFFFARPYKPWQRALNENTNGLIHEYFPKSTDFKDLTHQQVTKVMQALNNRPRKILNYQTPNEIFYADVALGK